SKAERVPLRAGDGVRLSSPGGGGFGDPLDRDEAAVEDDLNAGLVDRATAERVYGAAVAEARPLGDRIVYRLDRDRTRERRAALRSARA
ncbi:hypothetical protein OFN63_32155, partial [Escherichia coli]|nr:hypothetical protein [Escherichia coli]